MSVHGEFLRTLDLCLALLEAVPGPEAAARAAELRNARALEALDLCRAADAVIDASQRDGDADVFRDPDECAAFEERLAHLVSICRVITGRPEGGK